MAAAKDEPVFARQEQAVVYFFSRYWQQIEPFCHGRLSHIQTHFPDAAMEYAAADEWQAIEFEYALSSFDHHRERRGKKILNEDYDSLAIVYWEEDTDRDELRREIKQACKKLKKIEFVDLSKFFSPCVERELDRLGAYWEFRREKCFAQAYPLSEIEDETKALERDGLVRFLEVQDGRYGKDRIYRIAGFNTSNSDFIEVDHWRRIHFYSTSYFHDKSIPVRLLVKPTGTGRYSACFEIKRAFRILKPKDSRWIDYFRRFYFYPFKDYEPKRLPDFTCLVYSRLTPLDIDQGVKLHGYLDKRGYAQKMTSELITDSADLAQIDKIVG